MSSGGNSMIHIDIKCKRKCVFFLWMSLCNSKYQLFFFTFCLKLVYSFPLFIEGVLGAKKIRTQSSKNRMLINVWQKTGWHEVNIRLRRWEPNPRVVSFKVFIYIASNGRNALEKVDRPVSHSVLIVRCLELDFMLQRWCLFVWAVQKNKM